MSKQLDDTQFRYTPDVGTVAGPVQCGVCGTTMLETRNQNGPRGLAAAMGKRYSDYDEFLCPHHTAKWHQTVVNLRREAHGFESHRLSTIVLEEAEEVLNDALSRLLDNH